MNPDAARVRGMYRERSLEKLASPERLDELLRIVRPPAWLALGAVALGLGLVLTWAVLGRIPSIARGTAILVRPKQVVAFQAGASGTLLSIEVAVGDRVQEGDLLARIRLPALEKELEQERLRLAQFRDRSARLTALERELAQREREHLAGQRELITDRMEKVAADAERYRAASGRYIAEQRESLATSRARATELAGALQERFDSLNRLHNEGRLAADPVLEMRTRMIDNELRLADLDVQERELALRETAAQESYDSQLDLIRDLRIQLADLELREMDVARRLLEDELENASGEQEILRHIDALETRLATESRLVHGDGHPGRILEITAFPGQHVDVGDRLGKLEIEDPAAKLMALAYFPVEEGKKVRPGQPIRVSPSTVERERHGGILGRVVHVSEYPVTTDAAANQIGDLELARSLLSGQNRIEVLAELERETRSPTGFAWTSGDGPDGVLITAGTTGEARVTIEQRAPIGLVLPFLRSATGI